MAAILTSGGRTSITISRTVFRVDAGDDAGDSADSGTNVINRARSTRRAIGLSCSSTLPNVAHIVLMIKMHKVNPQDEGQ